MNAKAQIDAGICGFLTTVVAESQDNQQVTLQIESTCDKIKNLAAVIMSQNPIDAYVEILPTGRSLILKTAAEQLTGCCAGCVVPAGIFKAMQVAAGLALPKEIRIKFD